MEPPIQGRMRQGKGPYLFKKDWEDGHDPLKPHIETIDEKGEVTKKKPVSKAYNVLDMTDDELGDFLGEEERKALKLARQQRKDTAGRDLCKEAQEKKEKDADTLQQRNQVLESWARQQEAKVKDQEDKIKKLEANLEKVAGLLSQLISK